MSIAWSEIASLSATGLSAVAAVGACFAAHRSSSTAAAMARIERGRWHADRTPKFKITLERIEGDRAKLNVQLVGPLSLHRVDNIRMTINSSDDMDRTDTLPTEPTQEQINAQVWGPYRFVRGADGADADGHSVAPFSLQVGRGRPFAVERTRPPAWQEGSDVRQRWREQWANQPIRLSLRCRQEEAEKPWVVPYDVEVPGYH